MTYLPPSPTNLTIVVVEDEPVVRDLAVCELQDSGFQVVEFESADEALPYLRTNGDDLALVITDVQMPGSTNGLQLVDILSRLWPQLRVLVTSGGPLVNPANLPPRAKFLPKPWRPADMASLAGALATSA